MNTILPERSLFIRDRLNDIAKEIADIARDKIAMIILFGSYARGDWIQDIYTIDDTVHSYNSDLEVLIVIRAGKYDRYMTSKMEEDIISHLEWKGLARSFIQSYVWPSIEEAEEGMKIPSIVPIVKSINSLNRALKQKYHFLTNIKEEGILLYDNGKCKLAEIKELPWAKRKVIAQKDYDYWFNRGSGFLLGSNFYLDQHDNALAAFSLHQATESFYHAILLVFNGQKCKEHNILSLGVRVKDYNSELSNVFPCNTIEETECFKLLLRAYSESRDNKDYIISKAQLLYLTEEVKILQNITQETCLDYINRTEN